MIIPINQRNEKFTSVIYSYSSRGLHTNFQDVGGKEYVLTSTPAIFANSMGMLLASVSSGIGYGILPREFFAGTQFCRAS